MSNLTGRIRAIVNGEQRELPEDATLSTLIRSLALMPDRLAVELDRKIVKPEAWSSTAIPDGAEIEIVHFVGGG